VIEAIGEDWVVAREVKYKEPLIAHFQGCTQQEMEKMLMKWSKK
jgi:hypothetical protein